MKTALSTLVLVTILSFSARASALDAEVKAKIDAKLPAIRALAAETAVVGGAKEVNEAPSDEAKAMTQDKWKTLSVLDPFVRAFTKNAAATVVKEKKDAAVSEAFVNAANGTKVAFLAKPTNWSHAGKAKHDVPMKGEVWYGEVEVDESTGLQQVQVSVPVLDGEKVIGSLVVGLSVSKL